MKKVLAFVIIFLIAIYPIAGQTATIWGPGEDYEITFLHSGLYEVNSTKEVEFNNEASTEFTLQNLTNDGYDYTYVGYPNAMEEGSVELQTFSAGGIFTLTLPTGGMPVALPLSYGEEDDFLLSFSEKIDELGNLAPENDRFNLNSSTDEEYMYLEFATSSSSSTDISPDSVFFDLPTLQLPQYQNKNNTYINSTLSGDLSYKRSTGVLFNLNVTITADDLLVDSISQGPIYNTQSLEFVAIIPPASIIDEISFNIILIPLVLPLIPVLNVLRRFFTREQSL